MRSILCQFRQDVYDWFPHRADALMDLLDAASSSPGARSVVELSEKVVGFLVDSVSEVLRVARDLIEPPPPIVGSIDSEYIQAVVKLDDRLLILLDLQKLLSGGEARELEGFDA